MTGALAVLVEDDHRLVAHVLGPHPPGLLQAPARDDARGEVRRQERELLGHRAREDGLQERLVGSSGGPQRVRGDERQADHARRWNQSPARRSVRSLQRTALLSGRQVGDASPRSRRRARARAPGGGRPRSQSGPFAASRAITQSARPCSRTCSPAISIVMRAVSRARAARRSGIAAPSWRSISAATPFHMPQR